MTPEAFLAWKRSVAAYGSQYATDARTNRLMADQVAGYSPRMATRVRDLALALDNMARLAGELAEELRP